MIEKKEGLKDVAIIYLNKSSKYKELINQIPIKV